LESKLDGHLLAARLREDEKNKVIDMTKSLGLPRNIQMDLKERKKKLKSLTNITSVQCTFKI
jgi:hypothetical protein